MNARPRTAKASASAMAEALGALVDGALGPGRVLRAVHAEDWPDPTAAAGLPRALWERALGDVARDVLGRPSRQFRARLCALAWRLAGGAGEVPSLLGALVEIVHAGSLIVDDIEDASPVRRGSPALHVTHGVPRALNTGNWMYFWALDLIDDLVAPRTTRDEIRRALTRTMHDCHMGQALDVSIPIGELPRPLVYRTVATSTMLKTGALMEFAARSAALGAGADAEATEALARFGRRLGLGLQMLDDFGNLTAPASDNDDSKALEDLRGGRPTWPWALAATELDDAVFSELQGNLRDLVAARDAAGGDVVDGAAARALAAKLRMAVGMQGRRRATAYLNDALGGLREAVGNRPELALVAAEIERLEHSYG